MSLNKIYILTSYAETYLSTFKTLLNSGKANSRERAAETGKRALSYFIKAQAFDKLIDFFVSDLVASTNNPQLLQSIINELTTALTQIPKGETHWSVLTYLADALHNSRLSSQALPLYQQAVVEAETAQNWSNVGWICHNWANVLYFTGQLAQAKEVYLHSVNAYKKAHYPLINIIAGELEALRIDIMRAEKEKVKQILPEVESRLVQCRTWWQQCQNGIIVSEASDAELITKCLIKALDVAYYAYTAIGNWQNCLSLLDDMETVENKIGEDNHIKTLTKFNRYYPLLELGRLDEAQKLLEECLPVFRTVEDFVHQSYVLSGLAIILDRKGDFQQALALERQALSIAERLEDYEGIAGSYTNLGMILQNAGQTEEAAYYTLASIIYHLLTDNQQELYNTLRNFNIEIRDAEENAECYNLPQVSDLLKQSKFKSLKSIMQSFKVTIEELQTKINEITEDIRNNP